MSRLSGAVLPGTTGTCALYIPAVGSHDAVQGQAVSAAVQRTVRDIRFGVWPVVEAVTRP